MIKQYQITLPKFPRGFHIITDRVIDNIKLPEIGLLHIFIQHTSAGICINENADPSVLFDFEQVFNDLIPETLSYLTHTMEGPDDMPAHIKTSLVGSSINIPITGGKLNLGVWQGIYLCEFRNNGGNRNLVITIQS